MAKKINTNNHFHTLSDIQSACDIEGGETERRLCRITEEFREGFDFIAKIEKSVSFFGSTRAKENNPNYQLARKMAKRFVRELDYSIVTGGGPGIMEAANRGAKEAGGKSYGLLIKLPKGQKTNPYLTDKQEFKYFFARKVALAFAARLYIFLPGGYGTLDEFFELITLIQTKKIERIPIVLMGSQFWVPLEKFINYHLLVQNEAIDEQDLGLFTITDNEQTVIEIAKYAAARK
ncbi:MAG: TIGR00730 family Rossman fold protein [bacterium]|nr:TIGR00730 family Rossman fold protein [bacterium]